MAERRLVREVSRILAERRAATLRGMDVRWLRATCAEITGFGACLLDLRHRTPEVCMGRHFLCLAIRRHTAMSLPAIAKAVGMRSHSSVFHCIRRGAQIAQAHGPDGDMMRRWLDDLARQIEERS